MSVQDFLLGIARCVNWLIPVAFKRIVKDRIVSGLKPELKSELKAELKSELRSVLKTELKAELKPELKTELKTELRLELKAELEQEVKNEFLKPLFLDFLPARVDRFCAQISSRHTDSGSALVALRQMVRFSACLPPIGAIELTEGDLLTEIEFLRANAETLQPAFLAIRSKRVLFCGQAYYNAWYLSRALRALGWKADLYNWDTNPTSQIYYHGEDFKLGENPSIGISSELNFYVESLYAYDIFHFSNVHGIAFSWSVQTAMSDKFGMHAEIYLIKSLGKKIVYTNNGCQDGVSQTSFSKWGPESVCPICRWQNEPAVCSDERNLLWGAFRNSVSDYQCLLGGNRADYNDDPRVHEVPEFYCLDPEIWSPDIEIPEKYIISKTSSQSVCLYHAVGHREERTRSDGVNIKSSHVYLPLIDKLRTQGLHLDLIEPTGIPNKEVRYLQVQADIFLDMLTFGWFGANAREAMMLAKPVICFIRPEWLESLRKELPDYADELPVISATPSTVEGILLDLIDNPEKRKEIGQKSREFALKWHSNQAAGQRFDEIYSQLLADNPLLLQKD